MACMLIFECDGPACTGTGDGSRTQVVIKPLASPQGEHPWLRVVVTYPEGWGWDADGKLALCPKCLSEAEPRPESHEAHA